MTVQSSTSPSPHQSLLRTIYVSVFSFWCEHLNITWKAILITCVGHTILHSELSDGILSPLELKPSSSPWATWYSPFLACHFSLLIPLIFSVIFPTNIYSTSRCARLIPLGPCCTCSLLFVGVIPPVFPPLVWTPHYIFVPNKNAPSMWCFHGPFYKKLYPVFISYFLFLVCVFFQLLLSNIVIVMHFYYASSLSFAFWN